MCVLNSKPGEICYKVDEAFYAEHFHEKCEFNQKIAIKAMASKAEQPNLTKFVTKMTGYFHEVIKIDEAVLR